MKLSLRTAFCVAITAGVFFSSSVFASDFDKKALSPEDSAPHCGLQNPVKANKLILRTAQANVGVKG